MLNRRLLRVKVFQSLYAHYLDLGATTAVHESFLENSLKQLEEFYHFVLNLPVELKYFVETDHNPELTKFKPTEKDIKTGRTFIYNTLINKIGENEEFNKKLNKVKYKWQNHKEVLLIVFNTFKSSEYFQKFIEEPERNFEAQKKLLLTFFSEFLPTCEEFDQQMEEFTINWGTDKKVVLGSCVKSIELIQENEDNSFLIDMHDDLGEDLTFSKTLYRKTLINDRVFEDLISQRTKKWDSDRIAVVDMILMKMALCEILEFPEIPVKVSINEYLDISKVYSTPKSNAFLNGILDKIMKELKEEEKIVKTGRGLVE